MRWASSPVALALLCACGNLSNEDIAFAEAIPQKDQLRVQVPGGSAAQSLCANGSADIYTSAKTTGQSINAGVDGMLALVDSIRTVTPTTRDDDARTWGPFPDQKHPGVLIKVTMVRELDATYTPWRWIYTFTASRPPGGFLPIVEGEFFGAQARNGIGRITLHFESSRSLAINNPNDPNFPARFYYDLSGDPRTISVDLTLGVNAFGLVAFDYFFAGYADGHGRFDFSIPDPNSTCYVDISTFFNSQGAGRDVFHLRCGSTLSSDVKQCWDPSGCLTFIDDPFAFTPICGLLNLKPCLLGNSSLCPPGL
jgi:hypothetical protein